MLKTKISITLTAFALIISIIGMISLNTGGVAWFSENKDAYATGMKLSSTMDINKKIAAVECFKIGKIVLENDGSNTYYFRKIGSSVNGLDLGEHSALVAERQVLVRFTLADGVNEIMLAASSAKDKYIVENDITTANPTRVDKNGNSMSSIVQFQLVNAISEETTSITSSGSDGSLTTADEACYKVLGTNTDAPLHFSSIEISGTTVTRSFDRDISIGSSVSGIESGGKKYVYVIVDYYEYAADDVQQHVNNLIMSEDENNDYTDISSGEGINFVCDFSFVIR